MLTTLINMLASNLLYFILHISNNNSFPKPLSAKEEALYLEKMKNGDPAARTMLIEHNLRLVSHIIKKYYSKTNDTEDLISIGTIGLIKGIDSFDSSKGVRLATYASRCVENEVLMFFRAQKKTNQDMYMSDPIDVDKDGNPLTLIDIISDGKDLSEDLETKIKSEKILQAIRDMTNLRDKEIIIMRYGLNNKKPLTQQEVADRLKISRSYVSRIEKKTLEKLKAGFDKR